MLFEDILLRNVNTSSDPKSMFPNSLRCHCKKRRNWYRARWHFRKPHNLYQDESERDIHHNSCTNWAQNSFHTHQRSSHQELPRCTINLTTQTPEPPKKKFLHNPNLCLTFGSSYNSGWRCQFARLSLQVFLRWMLRQVRRVAK